ncbi:DUF3971 domain-containing protein [Actibacterium sp.]|uniref:YhdP family protein n=1 Tax=Actibacterium sp. TaxID=1872125 RepID=UPI00356280B3
MMDQSEPQPKPTQPSPWRPGRFGLWLMMTLAVLGCVFLVAVMSLTGRVVILPDWMTARIEARMDAALAPMDLSLGRTKVRFSRAGVPRVYFADVGVRDASGRPLAQLPDLTVTLATEPLLHGQIAVRRVALDGAELVLRRKADGDFDLALGDSVRSVTAESMGQVLDKIDTIFALPALASVESVSVEALHVAYADARAGRFWQVRDGLMTLDHTDTSLSAQLFFSLQNEKGTPSEVAMSFETLKGSPESSISANFSDVSASDIATQSPALAFLSVIDAPISGALRTGVSADGTLAPLSAALEIGAGALTPQDGTPPIRFDRGKAYFSYDPAAKRITMDEVSVKTDALSLTAEGHAYLRDEVNGWPTSMTTQMRLRQVTLTPKGVFAEPARFNAGAVDFKLTLDPFTATIGQAVLTDAEGADYSGSGRVTAGDQGWNVALDVALNQIEDQRLLQLWPVDVVPNTRKWVADNVQGGLIFDVKGALRLVPGARPVASLTYEFRDADVRFMKTMPPVQNGYGYSSIIDNSFTMVLNSGTVAAPQGGSVDAAGTVVQVPDIRQRPAQGQITLHTDSSIEAMLSLLDQPPLNILSKAGQPVDLAEGRAKVIANLWLPFVKGTQPNEVRYQVEGTLSGVRSDKLVRGRILTADQLEIRADTQELSIGGTAALDGVPVRGNWTQKIGPEHRGNSTVEGTVTLSQQAVEVFRIGLPPGSVTGQGLADIRLDLRKGSPAKFRLSSDLNRVGLQLDSLGWSKPANKTGSLEVSGSLAQPPVVDSLEFSATGLTATGGAVQMKEDGTLNAATFERVTLGAWLDAPITLVGRGADAAPEVQILGGAVDLRQSPLIRSSAPGSGTGTGPISVALDRLRVSSGIALSGVRGNLTTTGGLSGKLSGTVVGGAPVTITLAPTDLGTAIRVVSDDAGGVMRGAGIFEKSNGGTMDMLLAPLGTPGAYDGKLEIQRTRVKGAPALAELLSAISVVGILEMLDGEGLMFSEVSSRFRLTPEGLEVKRGSAVGPSLGISMAGVMDFKTNGINMQGVISPIYVLNGIGQIFSRRGEGLFGFNYDLSGDARAPKVSVNPLSILTPGMFREIFRRPPPGLPQ